MGYEKSILWPFFPTQYDLRAKNRQFQAPFLAERQKLTLVQQWNEFLGIMTTSVASAL